MNSWMGALGGMGTGGGGSRYLSCSSGDSRSDPEWQAPVRRKQQRLLLLSHASRCPHEDGWCPVTPHCAGVKRLWKHAACCTMKNCRALHCLSSRYVVRHYCRCEDARCPMCGPVMKIVRRAQSRRSSSSSGATRPTPDGSGGHQQSQFPLYLEWRKLLLLLRHASTCRYENGHCPLTPHCVGAKKLWKHIADCNDEQCQVQHCRSGWDAIHHFQRCKNARCPDCRPVREEIRISREKKSRTSLRDSSPLGSEKHPILPSQPSRMDAASPPGHVKDEMNFPFESSFSSPSSRTDYEPKPKRARTDPSGPASSGPGSESVPPYLYSDEFFRLLNLDPNDDVLFHLLSLNPNDKEERLKYDDGAVRELLLRYPRVAEKKYKFPPFGSCRINSPNFHAQYPLTPALRLGASPEVIKILCDAFPEAIKEKCASEGTVLHSACAYGASPEVVQLLLEAYPEAAKEKDDLRRTALRRACEEKASPEVIRLLVLAYPEAAKEKERSGWTVLRHACLSGASPEVLKILCDAFPEAVKEKDDLERTALHSSSTYWASLEVLQFLLGAYPEAAKEKDSDGMNPLHIACSDGTSLETVRLLLEAYPEAIKGKDAMGQTPLTLSKQEAEITNPEVIACLEVVDSFVNLDKPSNEELHEIFNNLLAMTWWEGVMLLINAHPSAVHKLGYNASIMPDILAKIGRISKLGTFFEVMRGVPDMAKDAQEK